MSKDFYLGWMLAQWIVLIYCMRAWPDDGEGSSGWILKHVISFLSLSMGLCGIFMGMAK